MGLIHGRQSVRVISTSTKTYFLCPSHGTTRLLWLLMDSSGTDPGARGQYRAVTWRLAGLLCPQWHWPSRPLCHCQLCWQVLWQYRASSDKHNHPSLDVNLWQAYTQVYREAYTQAYIQAYTSSHGKESVIFFQTLVTWIFVLLY